MESTGTSTREGDTGYADRPWGAYIIIGIVFAFIIGGIVATCS